MSELDLTLRLTVALGIGLLIGIERGWRDHTNEEGSRPAGMRTFTLIGLVGGLSGVLAQELSPIILALSFLGLSALLVAGYILSSRSTNPDRGFTSEVAAMSVFLLSATASFGYLAIATAGAVVVTALLGFKPAIHKWLENLTQDELLASLKLLLIALVALPLLPDEAMGPWGAFNLFSIGWMILLIATISYIGYLGVKIVGSTRGLTITAFFGGLASSTAVALSFARMAKVHPQLQYMLAAGVMIASSIMFPRVMIEVGVVNSALLPQILLPLSLMFIICLLGASYFWKTHKTEMTHKQAPDLKNPFEIMPALKFGLLLALILFLAKALLIWFGEEGIYLLAFISGIVDVDAVTLSLSQLAKQSPEEGGLTASTAVHGILIAAFTNTAFKLTFFMLMLRSRISISLTLILLLVFISGLAGLYLS